VFNHEKTELELKEKEAKKIIEKMILSSSNLSLSKTKEMEEFLKTLIQNLTKLYEVEHITELLYKDVKLRFKNYFVNSKGLKKLSFLITDYFSRNLTISFLLVTSLEICKAIIVYRNGSLEFSSKGIN
jgi:hypothetical protein